MSQVRTTLHAFVRTCLMVVLWLGMVGSVSIWLAGAPAIAQEAEHPLVDDLVPMDKQVARSAARVSGDPTKGGVPVAIEQHGWVFAQSIAGSGVAVFHLPPRRGANRRGISNPPVEPGTARSVRMIERPPVWSASWGSRVYLLYRTSTTRVDLYSLQAVPGGIDNYWLIEPSYGATAEPMLELAGATVVEAVGVGPLGGSSANQLGRLTGSVAVLVRSATGFSIRVLGDDAWQSIDLPDAVRSAKRDDRIHLVKGHRTLGLVVLDEKAPTLWSYNPDDGSWRESLLDGQTLKRAMPAGASVELLTVCMRGDWVCIVTWQQQPTKNSTAAASEKTQASDDHTGVVALDVPHQAGTLRVWSLGPAVAGLLVQSHEVNTPEAVVPMAEGSRLVVFHAVPNPTPQVRGGTTLGPIKAWEIVEYSLDTGQVLYRGLPISGALISAEDTRLLSVLMLGLSLGMLFYLLRPIEGSASDGSLVMPEGYALADPSTRVVATMIDVLLLAWIVGKVLSVPMMQLVLVVPLMGTTGGLWHLVFFGIVGIAYGTISEWLFGRTIGKVLTGSKVVSVVKDRKKIGLLRSGARNAFKWAFVPWALLGLFTLTGRHRGDEVAGAAVVVPTDVGPDVEPIDDEESNELRSVDTDQSSAS